MPKNSPPERLRHLPDILLDELEKLSDGDWRRVTLGADGDVVVHNEAQVFRVELEPRGTTAKKLAERARNPAPSRPVAETAPAASQQSAAPAVAALPAARPRPSVVLPPATPRFTALEGVVRASSPMRRDIAAVQLSDRDDAFLQGAGEPVEGQNDEGVAGRAERQARGQLRAVGVRGRTASR